MTHKDGQQDGLADWVAGAWFVILIGGVVGIGALAMWKVEITGTVSANAVVQNVVYPATITLGVVVVIVSWIAARELFGKTQTRSVIGQFVSLVRDAGAADELRRVNGHLNEDDEE